MSILNVLDYRVCTSLCTLYFVIKFYFTQYKYEMMIKCEMFSFYYAVITLFYIYHVVATVVHIM